MTFRRYCMETQMLKNRIIIANKTLKRELA